MRPRDGWEVIISDRIEGKAAAGLVYWRTLEPEQVEAIEKAPWYKGKPLQDHPMDSGAKRAYYLKGLVAMHGELWKNLELPEPGPDWHVLAGEALRQQGVKLVDVGDLVEVK